MAMSQDYIALEWVKGEIHETLQQAQQSLEIFSESPEDRSRLKFCFNYLHQVHGTLQMVEFFGAALLAEEMEAVAAALYKGALPSEQDGLEVLMQAIIHLPHYLDHVKIGQRDLPIVLLPILNELRSVRGENLLSETALFKPVVEHNTALSDAKLARYHTDDFQQWIRKVRQMLQAAVAQLLQDKKPDVAKQYLLKVFTRLDNALGHTPMGVVWLPAMAFCEWLQYQQHLPSSAKLLLKELDGLVKQIIRDGAPALNNQASDELVKNLLFYVARTQFEGEAIKAVFDKFALGSALPSETEIQQERDALAGPDRDTISHVLTALVEEIAIIKDKLDLAVRGDTDCLDALRDVSPATKQVCDTMGVVGLGMPRQVMQAQLADMAALVDIGKVSQQDLFDIAGALLYVEATLTGMIHEGKLTEQVGQSSLTDAHRAVLREARNVLEQVKDSIVAYVSKQWDTSELQDVPALLHTIAGSFGMIPLNRVAAALHGAGRYVDHVIATDSKTDWSTLDSFADVVSGIEYFVERYAENPDNAGDEILDRVYESLAALGYEEDPDEVVQEIASKAAKTDTVDPTAVIDQVLSGGEPVLKNQVETAHEALQIIIEDRSESTDSIEQPFSSQQTIETSLADSETVQESVEDDVATHVGSDESVSIPDMDGESTVDNAVEANDSSETVPLQVEVEAEPATELSSELTHEAESGSEPETDLPPQTAETDQSLQQAFEAEVDEEDEDDLIDDEIIEIFLEEAEEVTETLDEFWPVFKSTPSDGEALTTVRRAFHTLKGSGRMVNALVIGELAWSIENMFNRVIDKTIQVDKNLTDIVDHTLSVMPALIDDFRCRRKPSLDTQPLMDYAFAVADGKSVGALQSVISPAENESSTSDVQPVDDESVESAESSLEQEAGEPSTSIINEESASVLSNQDEDDEDGNEDSSLLAVFVTEAKGHLDTIQTFVDQSRTQNYQNPIDDQAQRALHTLKGSAHMAEISAIAKLAAPLERILKELRAYHAANNEWLIDLLDDATRMISGALSDKSRLSSGMIGGEQTYMRRLQQFEVAILEPLQESAQQEIKTPDPQAISRFLQHGMDSLLDAENLIQEWYQSGNPDCLQALVNDLVDVAAGADDAEQPQIANLSIALEGFYRKLLLSSCSPEKRWTELAAEGQEELLNMMDCLAAGQVIPDTPVISRLVEQTGLVQTAPSIPEVIQPEPEPIVDDVSPNDSAVPQDSYVPIESDNKQTIETSIAPVTEADNEALDGADTPIQIVSPDEDITLDVPDAASEKTDELSLAASDSMFSDSDPVTENNHEILSPVVETVTVEAKVDEPPFLLEISVPESADDVPTLWEIDRSVLEGSGEVESVEQNGATDVIIDLDSPDLGASPIETEVVELSLSDITASDHTLYSDSDEGFTGINDNTSLTEAIDPGIESVIPVVQQESEEPNVFAESANAEVVFDLNVGEESITRNDQGTDDDEFSGSDTLVSELPVSDVSELPVSEPEAFEDGFDETILEDTTQTTSDLSVDLPVDTSESLIEVHESADDQGYSADLLHEEDPQPIIEETEIEAVSIDDDADVIIPVLEPDEVVVFDDEITDSENVIDGITTVSEVADGDVGNDITAVDDTDFNVELMVANDDGIPIDPDLSEAFNDLSSDESDNTSSLENTLKDLSVNVDESESEALDSIDLISDEVVVNDEDILRSVDESLPVDVSNNEVGIVIENASADEEVETAATEYAVEETPVIDMASAPDVELPVADLYEVEENDDDDEIIAIFLEEAEEIIEVVEHILQDWQADPDNLVNVARLQRELHTIKGGARMAEQKEVAELCHELETLYERIANGRLNTVPELFGLLQEAHDSLGAQLDDIKAHVAPQPAGEVLARLHKFVRGEDIGQSEPATFSESTSTDVAIAMSEAEDIQPSQYEVKSSSLDESDREILEIFLEEAIELHESLDRTLHDWETGNASASSEAQRVLHTLKGGARLAGLVDIGNLAHDFEARIVLVQQQRLDADSEFFKNCYQRQDSLVKRIERVSSLLESGSLLMLGEATIEEADIEAAQNNPALPAPVAAVSGSDVAVVPDASSVDESKPATPAKAAAVPQQQQAVRKAPQELVKVSADLLDSLVNLAGETSIGRGRLEQQVVDFTHTLEEMDMTLDRLRDQLRRLDIETEAQVLFRQERQGPEYEDFDPLEMDRYSTIQQLSRALVESASDLNDLRDTLGDKARDAETLLLQQSRVNTELQEGLMKTRMVPFQRLVPRLRRIVRQVSLELGKQVEFKVLNADGELDRTILERMISPLEHMVRNAVDHGVESPQVRQESGKPVIGNIELEVSRDGGDVVLTLRDDGDGVNLPAVRKKAIERGMLEPDAVIDDHDLIQFILQAGFSTAKNVTQISGRGVGLDVVSTEIKQMGGSVEIHSEKGQGTRFEVRLPFTVSVNRALMVRVGDDLYAVPLNNIQGIVRISAKDLQEQYEKPMSERKYHYAGRDYRLDYLGGFLDNEAHPKFTTNNMPMPVLLVHGVVPFALQVDTLLGSREIVVKALGPQFGSVMGVSGGTILGDGSVVIILDLPAMIRTQASLEYQQAKLLDQQEAEKRKVLESRQSRIMVVDDSVTVRKVTTRLLERNGMEVRTAKDGMDAMETLQDHRPDLMLLDIEMPRMDGFEVASLIRHDSVLKDIPIIMITSRTGDKHRDRAFSIGVNEYMGKPFQEDQLLSTINKLLNTEDS